MHHILTDYGRNGFEIFMLKLICTENFMMFGHSETERDLRHLENFVFKYGLYVISVAVKKKLPYTI